MKINISSIVVLLGLLLSSNVYATVGYFSLGYGAKSHGLAGATTALPQDALAAAVNPASIAFVGEQVDINLLAFNPNREAKIYTSAAGADFDVGDSSSRDWFFIPNGGIIGKINEQLWWSVALYANGGLNTDYHRNLYDESAAAFGALAFGATPAPGATTGIKDTGRLSVDYGLAVIAPTLAFKFHPQHSIGLSVLLGLQYFRAEGLGNFQCLTGSAVRKNPAACAPGGAGPLTPGFQHSSHLTDNGREWAYGVGVRLGWQGQVHERVTLAAAVASKIYMTEFHDYKELFAEDGDFDVPANFSVGMALKATDELDISFDFQRIFYSDVNSISNRGPVAGPFGPMPGSGSGLLGADNGLGFGWNDINVYRIGLQYKLDSKWTIRSGFSWNDSPISNKEILFNILAPAVIKKHATFGISYAPTSESEFTIGYLHGFKETQKANTAFGVPAKIEMEQNAIDVGYSWRF